MQGMKGFLMKGKDGSRAREERQTSPERTLSRPLSPKAPSTPPHPTSNQQQSTGFSLTPPSVIAPTVPSAPIFANMSPRSIRTIAAPTKADAPPSTTDPSTFEGLLWNGYARNEENQGAKRLMQDSGWREQHTAASEGFIQGYYQRSRLHHLSTWKAELKVLVGKAQQQAESGELVKEIAPGAARREQHSLSLADATLPRAEKASKSINDSNNESYNSGRDRIIFHVDFDAFFVSCGLATRPELIGKPTVVCHSQGGQGGTSSTSEIASCSYEARAHGVKNGMSLGQARRLCPEVQTIP